MSDWPRGMSIRPIQAWPGELTRERKRSPFAASWRSTLQLLDRELWFVAQEPGRVLQVAMPESAFRIDGYPRATAKAEHPGVILSFRSDQGEDLSFPCDRFLTWQDNVRAIALALEALRKVDRYGITRRGEQYTGWKQLGSGIAMPAGMTADQALGVVAQLSAELPGYFDFDRDMARYREHPDELRRDFRVARGLVHPDRRDGDRTAWDRLEQAGIVLGLVS